MLNSLELNGKDQHGSCACWVAVHTRLSLYAELGTDGYFGEATLLECTDCGQFWLKYHYEVEAFSGSGRWYLGAITAQQAGAVTAEDAKTLIESLDWYYSGGSYFGGRIGKASGRVHLNP